VEKAFKVIEGRWKLLILFHLFGGKILRFSELERAIPAISQKMLIQQLRQMEMDGMVRRIVHHQVPPKVEYGLTDWGQAALSGPRCAAQMGGTARGNGQQRRRSKRRRESLMISPTRQLARSPATAIL
jgi:DNA-binding HxlR family transcriptional regulator